MEKSIFLVEFNKQDFFRKSDNFLRCSHCGEMLCANENVYIIQDPITLKVKLRHQGCLDENLKQI